MLTRKRYAPPALTGDWKVDGPNLVKSISEYLLSLEGKGALNITEATVSGVVADGTIDLNGNDLIIDADGDSYLHEVSDDVVALVTGGTERFRVASGSFGLGVTPSAWFGAAPIALQVKQSALSANSDNVQGYFSANLYFDGATWRYINTGQAGIIGITTQTTTAGMTFWGVASGTAGASATLVELGRLTSTGLGIGVTPSYKLHVDTGAVDAAALFTGSNPQTKVYVENSATDGDPVFVARIPGTRAWMFGIDDSDSDAFKIAPTEDTDWADAAIVVTTGGNVGIGVTPSYALHVNSGQIAAPDGSAAAPTYSFASSGNADTGIYLPASNEVAVAGAGAMLTTFKTDRLTFASGYHVTTATATGTTPAIQSGTYTPTFTNVANCDSFTARQAQWMRVGNVVTVSGRVEVDFTSAATATSFRCSLPMASNFADAYDCAGVAVCNTSAVSGTKVPFYVLADSTNDEASISGEAPNTASNIVIFTFTFEVL